MQSTCYSSHILIKLEFYLQIFKKEEKPKILDFIKIRPVGAELFHVDGRTDMTKLMVAFRNSANAHKNHQARSIGNFYTRSSNSI
jgi:hypothetical protein